MGTKGSLSFAWERSNELHFFSADDEKRTGGFRRIMLGGIHPEADPFWYAQGQGLGYGEAFAITARRMIEAVAKNDPPRGRGSRRRYTSCARSTRPTAHQTWTPG